MLLTDSSLILNLVIYIHFLNAKWLQILEVNGFSFECIEHAKVSWQCVFVSNEINNYYLFNHLVGIDCFTVVNSCAV